MIFVVAGLWSLALAWTVCETRTWRLRDLCEPLLRKETKARVVSSLLINFAEIIAGFT
jgi:hypothetical protein